MIRLIGVGDNTLDTYTHIRTKFPGGNALNVAVLARRCGADSAYIGAVGDDSGGEWILESLKNEGVDVTHCKILKNIKNSFVEVNIKEGERFFESSFRGASSQLELSQEDFEYIQNFDIVHTSIYSGLEKQIEQLKKVSKILSFDFSDS
ncbi:MAG: fructoselysine kinase, partial [Bacteroidales bacterium]|nr:fructoselysine kinase [Bacteroidales bacterium]